MGRYPFSMRLCTHRSSHLMEGLHAEKKAIIEHRLRIYSSKSGFHNDDQAVLGQDENESDPFQTNGRSFPLKTMICPLRSNESLQIVRQESLLARPRPAIYIKRSVARNEPIGPSRIFYQISGKRARQIYKKASPLLSERSLISSSEFVSIWSFLPLIPPLKIPDSRTVCRGCRTARAEVKAKILWV